MKLEYSLYQLTSANKGFGSREGALLKFIFDDSLIGYADCHPWPELGDQPLSQQLHLLGSGAFDTPTLTRAKHFAQLDAMARNAGVNLFEGVTIPNSNCLIADLKYVDIPTIVSQGYKKFKFKIATPFESDLILLKPILAELKSNGCKARLDFNSRLTLGQFEKFLNEIKDSFETIDFFEDPFPYNRKQWTMIRQKYPISLACDRSSELAIHCHEAADILVIKPAIQDEAFLSSSSQKIVVTSYLDHPLGQLTAAYTAAKIQKEKSLHLDICGLLTQHAYLENDFSKKLLTKGPALYPPEGSGFGFDMLLKELPWRSL